MFISHLPELAIVLIVALVIFGPKRLPEMGASLGQGIREFRAATREMQGDGPETRLAALLTGHDAASPEAIALPIVHTEGSMPMAAQALASTPAATVAV